VVGHRAGEESAIEVTFPADFVVEKLRNKTVQFAILLK
jgi:FKBP-type peptidyl-prolyl cis-trans isomerase (trigger factor)